MTEAQHQAAFRDVVKKDWPHAVWFKLNDRANGGVPDVSLDEDGRHWWIELKRIDENKNLRSDAVTPPRQLAEMLRLQRASRHRGAWYVVFNEGTGLTEIWLPSALLEWKRNPRASYAPRLLLSGYNYRGILQFLKGA